MEPTEENVRKWIDEIGHHFGANFAYSPLLHRRLADRSKHVSWTVKNKKGGRSIKSFRLRQWTIPLEKENIESASLLQEVKQLKDKVASLQKEKEVLESTAATRCEFNISLESSSFHVAIILYVRIYVCLLL